MICFQAGFGHKSAEEPCLAPIGAWREGGTSIGLRCILGKKGGTSQDRGWFLGGRAQTRHAHIALRFEQKSAAAPCFQTVCISGRREQHARLLREFWKEETNIPGLGYILDRRRHKSYKSSPENFKKWRGPGT
jgi:hypothetical protein